jgi:hypothetical protein
MFERRRAHYAIAMVIVCVASEQRKTHPLIGGALPQDRTGMFYLNIDFGSIA